MAFLVEARNQSHSFIQPGQPVLPKIHYLNLLRFRGSNIIEPDKCNFGKDWFGKLEAHAYNNTKIPPACTAASPEKIGIVMFIGPDNPSLVIDQL